MDIPQLIGELKQQSPQISWKSLKENAFQVSDNFLRRSKVCLQRRGAHSENIWERAWFVSKLTKITENLGNDRTRTEILVQKKNMKICWIFEGFNKVYHCFTVTL